MCHVSCDLIPPVSDSSSQSVRAVPGYGVPPIDEVEQLRADPGLPGDRRRVVLHVFRALEDARARGVVRAGAPLGQRVGALPPPLGLRGKKESATSEHLAA